VRRRGAQKQMNNVRMPSKLQRRFCMSSNELSRYFVHFSNISCDTVFFDTTKQNAVSGAYRKSVNRFPVYGVNQLVLASCVCPSITKNIIWISTHLALLLCNRGRLERGGTKMASQRRSEETNEWC